MLSINKSKIMFFLNVIRFMFFLLIVNKTAAICPDKCQCKKLTQDNSSLKVKCGGTAQSKILNFKELDFGDDYQNVIQLDLSKNQISYVDKDDFKNYTHLKRLDLSLNSFKQIDDSMFGELPNLERLKLSTNVIVHIHQGSFENLKSLKQLDISGNPLACDCDLLWLIAWSNSYAVKLQPSPKCETPAPFKGFLLKKLKVGSDLHCESPLQPLLELKPDTDQLAFEGDVLLLRCRAPRVAVGPAKDSEDLPARAHVFWGYSDRIVDPNSTDDIIFQDPTKIFSSIHIDAKHLSDSGLLDSILRIPNVTRNHSGMWDCRLRSDQANLSRTISLVVISANTKYCEATEVRTNKGHYYLPRTIRAQMVRLACSEPVTPINLYATFQCSAEGKWIDFNTNACPFISETTRIFEQFAKVNLSIAKGSVLESAKRLRNFTQSEDNLKKIRDPQDLVFIAKTLRNYLDFVQSEKDLGSMLLDIVSQMLTLPHFLSEKAEIMDNSGTKLLQSVELAGQYTPLAQTHKPNLALEFFKIRFDSFSGMTCSWIKFQGRNQFQCNTASFDLFRQHVIASVQIPVNILNQQQAVASNLMVAVYENANFLPHINNYNSINNNTKRSQNIFRVTSAVIAVKILNDLKESLFENLTEPIQIMLRIHPYHNTISTPVPVVWDTSGSWNRDNCQMSYQFYGLMVFSCWKFGYFGLLQNVRYLNDFEDPDAGARFRISPIGFYVGCSILFISTWINIVTYLACGNAIQMARRQRHALINTWLAMSFLSFCFAVGIFQTEDYKICELFGISIHYFSLCVILWICVSVSNMYKRLSKRNRRGGGPAIDEPLEHVGGKKPILGIYLVGWGIGLIICGISGAVNMREYASYSYCFLGTGPSLSAIFVPATILLLFLAILFICVRCHIRIVEEVTRFSEGTQATENVDLELLESTTTGGNLLNTERYRSLTMSSPTSTSLQDDSEQTNSAQLRAHLIFLILYILCWSTAAGSLVHPLKDRGILYEEEAFSILFAIFSTLLAFFVLIFYSVSRADVRNQWSMWSCKNFCWRQNCRRRRSVSDTKELNTVAYHHQQPQPCNGTLNSNSRSNSQCSKTRPLSAQGVKNLTELNSQANGGSPNKLLQPVVAAQRSVHSPLILTQEIPNAEIFYNPNQINVARKFFKKQKRLAKRNNFELQRQIKGGVNSDFGDGAASDSTSGYPAIRSKGHFSIFGGGSKINNTNIHVDGFSKDQKQQSINILSDSCNESTDRLAETERLVLGAEGLRVLSNAATNRNKMNNMIANIYTNVPETKQPQHEIVTMRADEKFKRKNIADLLEQDELEAEANDLNCNSERSSTPLYVNSNIRNIIQDDSDNQNATVKRRKNVHSDKNIKNKINEPPMITSLQLEENNENKITENFQKNDLQNSSSSSSDQLILSLNSPIHAMNTLGLPNVENNASPSQNGNIPLNINTFSDGAISAEDVDNSADENKLDLDKNEAYVSAALEISDKIYKSDNNGSIHMIPQQKKSKSLIDLDAFSDFDGGLGCNRKFSNNFHETQIRSISCTNLSQLSAIITPQKHEVPQSNSPILFSPSMCDGIDDLPSPSIQDRRRPIVLAADSIIPVPIEEQQASCSSSNNGEDITPHSDSLFSQSIRRNFTSSSPTCESDLNYQNSELSIRSHGLYAPQPEDHCFYPYQSSELSDLIDDDEFDDYNNCSNDYLLPPDQGSQTSLDELYQRITRGAEAGTAADKTEYDMLIGESNSILTDAVYDGANHEKIEVNNVGSSINSGTIIANESNNTAVGVNNKLNETFTNDDDSSQGSIISYIDPTGKVVQGSSQRN